MGNKQLYVWIEGTIFASLAIVLYEMQSFWHFVAGVVFWGSYAPGTMNPLLYSFVANGASAILTAVITSIALILVYTSSPRLYRP